MLLNACKIAFALAFVSLSFSEVASWRCWVDSWIAVVTLPNLVCKSSSCNGNVVCKRSPVVWSSSFAS
eukprot:1652978-Pyramimonas_sp.AAC.1